MCSPPAATARSGACLTSSSALRSAGGRCAFPGVPRAQARFCTRLCPPLSTEGFPEPARGKATGGPRPPPCASGSSTCRKAEPCALPWGRETTPRAQLLGGGLGGGSEGALAAGISRDPSRAGTRGGNGLRFPRGGAEFFAPCGERQAPVGGRGAPGGGRRSDRGSRGRGRRAG